MRYFCTYFDSRYLARGLALYASLCEHCAPFRLWVLCMDRACHETLSTLQLPAVELVSLEEFEAGDEALRSVKPFRTPIEYYFTCTPSWPLYLLRRYPDIDRISYLDADLYFFADPLSLEREVGGRSIAIIPHRFPQRLRHQERFGIYNVGWLSFARNDSALACLERWRRQCLDWCFDRVEPGKFADQKYLDEWPSRFDEVAVVRHPGADLGPWNLAAHRLTVDNGRVLVDGTPLLFYHFHGLKQVCPWLYDANVGRYGVRLSPVVRRQIYAPYIRALRIAQARADRPATTGTLTRRVEQRLPQFGSLRRVLGLTRVIGGFRGLAQAGRAVAARSYILALSEHVG